MQKTSKIFIAGARGLVGSSLVRCLSRDGYSGLLTPPRAELDLTDSVQVKRFFQKERPDVVFMAAGKVGGIEANSHSPYAFLIENMQMASNTISAAHEVGVQKFVYLGSSCIYPKHAPQPMPESSLLSSSLEPTNEAYALAKIVGVKMCEYLNRERPGTYLAAMPCNLYGPKDNYHPLNSHVIPGLIRRFHEAKVFQSESVVMWGSGTPLREFLYVEDLAEALVLLAQSQLETTIINVGSGQEIQIRELANLVAQVVGFHGKIEVDSSKPDGTPRKILNNSKIHHLGWKAKTDLKLGLISAYKDFLERHASDYAQRKAS